MKITIITPSLNSEKTIQDTLDSVSSQTYKNIEHIVIDGESEDETLNILSNYTHKKKYKIFIKKTNVYEAINYGIKKSTGKIIGILAADDIYQNNNIISTIVKNFKTNKKKIIIGSLVYFSNFDYNKVLRYYSNKDFKYSQFKFGMMPPHPATFVKKEIYEKYGLYDQKIKISSDFKFFLNLIYKKKIDYQLLNKTLIRMRIGGLSTKNFYASVKTTKEINEILKKEKVRSNYFFLLIRFILKFKQLILIPKNINKDFALNSYIEKRVEDNNRFKIINNPNNLIKNNKSFVLSALNLAFLGYFGVGTLKLYKSLYHWPDGYYSEKIFNKLKKIPGRDMLGQIENHKNIKKIHIIGNFNKLNKDYLQKKFYGKKIINTPLPMMDEQNIKKYVPKISEKDLIFITLPTPKQEIMAEFLAKANDNFKIICIGASINIVSGHEKPVPKILYSMNLEWLWRLRNDSKRRLTRIFQSYFFFTLSYYKKKYSNFIIEYLNQKN